MALHHMPSSDSGLGTPVPYHPHQAGLPSVFWEASPGPTGICVFDLALKHYTSVGCYYLQNEVTGMDDLLPLGKAIIPAYKMGSLVTFPKKV